MSNSRIQRLKERIKKSSDISSSDTEKILEFSDQLFLKNYSDPRHGKLLNHCILISEGAGKLSEALTSKQVAEDIVRWIHKNYENEETNRDFRVALRVFGKHVTDGDSVPSSIEWVSATTSRSYDPQPDPSNMLSWEKEVQDMIEAARFSRNSAMVAVAWDAGLRSGEFRSLKIGDVGDHEYGLSITVDGKRGQRSLVLIPSVPYLRRWLNNHPESDNPDSPLWSKLDKPESFSYNMFRKIFERLADRAGIKKPVTLTNFRKSRASHLASDGMSQAHLEDRMGWVRGSDVASRYVSIFSESNVREFAKIHGVDVKDKETKDITPLECPRCMRETPREEEVCVWCGQALNPEAVRKLEGVEDRAFDFAVSADRDVEGEAVEIIRKLLEEYPTLKSAVLED